MKYINWILQLFFIRLTRCEEHIVKEFTLTEVSVVQFDNDHALRSDGKVAVGGYAKTQMTEYWYSIQGWIVPFTGWSGDMIRWGKQWFWQLTTRKEKNF